MSVRSTDEVRPLEPHADWSAADVADQGEWTHQLTGSEIAELEEALAVARSRTAEVLDVHKDDFPLPTLGPVLETIAAELINGRGFQRISALPVERVGFEVNVTVGQQHQIRSHGVEADVPRRGKAPVVAKLDHHDLAEAGADSVRTPIL